MSASEAPRQGSRSPRTSATDQANGGGVSLRADRETPQRQAEELDREAAALEADARKRP
jgi:hypothetical protein